MLSTNMGAIQTVELSSDDCWQEDKRVLEELEILMYALDLGRVEEDLWRKEIFERSSRELKILWFEIKAKKRKLKIKGKNANESKRSGRKGELRSIKS
jgi:hypothetical protein